MIDTKLLVGSALAAFTAIAATGAFAGPAAQPDYSFEKCYGVSKSGTNDCQTSTHSCAGGSKRARDKESWIYVPAGTCAKIDGASARKT